MITIRRASENDFERILLRHYKYSRRDDMDMKQFKEFEYTGGGVCAAKGFKASGYYCGISKKPLTKLQENNAVANGDTPENNEKKKNDVGLIYAEKLCKAAAVYTQNKVKGAPILVTQKNLKDGMAQAVIVNSKNANTCNADGIEIAEKMCSLTADALSISKDDIIVASTGVIGQPLYVEPIEKNMKNIIDGLSTDGSDACATAIMTTDTKKKEIAVKFKLGETVCHLGGIAKGSGMIHPNMATMLCFLTTDVEITSELLSLALSDITKITFNRVSVDGDTSTNDMACIMASGCAENKIIKSENDDFETFKNALYIVMMQLSREIARDGEGATKLLECICCGAEDEEVAQIVSKSVITSSLFKSAMFGEDANWGRILCAIGYADTEFDINLVDVVLASEAGSIKVCENGSGLDFSEEEAKKILSEEEIKIIIDLNSGDATSIAWGCDLTYDYVKINGDYRT